MKKSFLLLAGMLTAGIAWAQGKPEQADVESAGVRVSGSVNAGVMLERNEESDEMDLVYSTNNPRLGDNTGNQYFSEVDGMCHMAQVTYGADLHLDFNPKHRLSLVLEGEHDYECVLGSREESLKDRAGKVLESVVSGTYNQPRELNHDILAGLDYTYRLRRPGEMLSVGYRYHWERETSDLEQHITETKGWSKYTDNALERKTSYHTHHAHLDYVYPVVKGHLLDFGLAYDRRELSTQTRQDWDNVRVLDADYRHLTQYGGVHARYRMKLGPVEAMARLEYRATKMQNRWLHDVLPTATVRYHIDTIHSLSAFYTIVLIRPDAQHLDTTHISDAYTESYGNDRVAGIHVHNVALGYQANWSRAKLGAEVRYLTTTDGFNAIWKREGEEMGKYNRRIYTWGNEGVRHAVSLKPSVDGHLSPTTELCADVTVLWDKRIASAINIENANWGVQTNVRLEQRLTPLNSGDFAMFLDVRGDYSYHNTLNVYSYADHGGSVGADLKMAVKSVNLALGYTCLFKPDVHIVQGAYVGILSYQPGARHELALTAAYEF